MAGNDDVGYGKPPKDTRFKKGRSGNPKGRPKRSRNFSKLIEDELGSKVNIREGETTSQVTKQQAIVMRMANRAMNGDVRALKWIEGYLPDAFFKDERTNIEAARQELQQILDSVARKHKEELKEVRRELRTHDIPEDLITEAMGLEEEEERQRHQKVRQALRDHGVPQYLVDKALGPDKEDTDSRSVQSGVD